MTVDNGQLVVKQIGGHGVGSRKVLRDVARGAIWSPYEEAWRYPLTPGLFLSLEAAADALGAQLEVPEDVGELGRIRSEINQRVEHELNVRQRAQELMDDRDLPLPAIKVAHTSVQDPPPWPHQARAWWWAMQVQSIYLAHKPGLGKTRSAADIIRGRMQSGDLRWPRQHWNGRRWTIRGGVLVVCPKIMLGTWRDELAKWQNIPSLVVWHPTRAEKLIRAAMPAWVHVCTYGSLDAVADNLYDGIIADEMHLLASEDSVRFERMMQLRERDQGQKEPWLVALSGTPMPNMLPSLWSQYYWLDQGLSLGTSMGQYLAKYFENPNCRSRSQLTPKKGADDDIAGQVSRITFFYSMSEAFPEKPEPVHQVMRVPMTKDQVRYYEQVRNKALADILTGTVSPDQEHVILLKLLQICQGFVKDDDGVLQTFNSAKLDALQEMMTGTGDLAGERVVVWCRFRYDLERVTTMLQRRGVPTLQLHGGLKEQEREGLRRAWDTDYRWRVIVGMIQMGIGINLPAVHCVDNLGQPARCSTSVFYGYDWKMTELEQAMDRIYRGNQPEPCLFRYLISEDLAGYGTGRIAPIDFQVYESLLAKLTASEELSEGSTEYVRKLLLGI